jgi:membrane protease YdiL (CAAX protease family)
MESAARERSLASSFAIGIAWLIAWLVVLAYIASVRSQLRLFLYGLAICSFLAVHARARKFSDDAVGNGTRDGVFLRSPRRNAVLPLTALAALTILSRPWAWWISSGACTANIDLISFGGRQPSFGNAGSGIMALLGLLLVATVSYVLVEEFAFRGWLFRPLELRYGSVVAIVMTSILFAIAHFRPATLGADFIFGLILGATLVTTQSIWAPVTIHVAANMALGALSLDRVKPYLVNVLATPLFSCAGTYLAYGIALSLSAIVLWIIHRTRDKGSWDVIAA